VAGRASCRKRARRRENRIDDREPYIESHGTEASGGMRFSVGGSLVVIRNARGRVNAQIAGRQTVPESFRRFSDYDEKEPVLLGSPPHAIRALAVVVRAIEISRR